MVATMPEAAPRGLPMSQWSPVVQLLADLIDTVRENTAATVAAAGGGKPEMQPYLRPETEIDRAKRRRRLAAHQDLVARVLPAQNT